MAIMRRVWLPWAAAVLLLGAAPGALGQTCSSTSTCPANTCCNTLAASPFSCVAGPFVNGVQVCNCKGLEAKGLKCPADKPYCCGSSGLCVADVAQCSCVTSTGCPTGSCCSKAKAGWSSSSSIGTCSLAPFSADGKYCQCSTASRLNGVTCPACCGQENRCAAQATECSCASPTHCPTGSCCSKTAAAWTAGSSGKCSADPGATGGTGAYCDCTLSLNGLPCGSCCYDNKCGASTEACPCRSSSDCRDGAGAQSGCCSKTADKWQAASDGRCSKQMTGGPLADSFCDCFESFLVVNMTCPPSSKPGPVSTCCQVPGIFQMKCGDICDCDLASGPYCPPGECCSYTAEAGTGVCMTEPLDTAGNQVCSDCNTFSGVSCPASKAICCPDGSCAASPAQCGCIRDKDCPAGSCCNKATKQCSASLFATVGGVSKQVCSNCGREGMACPTGTSYCCKNGKCAAKLEDCNCRYASDCQYGSCCARAAGTNVGKCNTRMYNGTVQVCPNCARAGDNGVNCPSTRPECCPDGTCGRSGLCPAKTQCYGVDGYCPFGQCCGDDSFCRTTIFAGTRQSCADCNTANGLACPAATPVCCARGQCVAKLADCTSITATGKVFKYQAHHLTYLDSVANATAALDQSLLNGQPTRPSPDQFYDFRPFVEQGWMYQGSEVYCSSRWDPATNSYLRGLDYKTAPGTLAWASDLAAQLWFAECSAMPKCKADMAADSVTLARLKIWTKRAADKMLSYLQLAPAGRNVLCPPRAYFGFFYQTFVRPNTMNSAFYNIPNWAGALNPSYIKIKNAAGADDLINALELIKRAEDLRGVVPEPLLAMEGLIELLIGHDHTLLPTVPNPILPTSASAAAPASADGAAPTDAGAALASAEFAATQSAAAAVAMDAGPVAPASYAENGFVAGVANPESLKSVVPPKPSGCAEGDLLCVAKSLGLLGAQAAGAAPEGAVSQLSADGAQIMAGERDCLNELRRQQTNIEAAKDFVTLYRPAGVWVDPVPAKRAVAIDRPLFEMQFDKGVAVYTFACATVPDFTAKACSAQQSTLQDFMDTYKAVLATFASFTCDPAATSYRHINALADGQLFPVIEPGMSTGAQCTKFTYDFNVDRGIYIINYLFDRYGKAVTCCASDCDSRPECIVLTYLWNEFHVPECRGDSAAASVNKMPTGLALPPTSGATCGCGDGKGYYGWGVYSG